MSGWAGDGVACEDHVGEVWPPRCAACDALRANAQPRFEVTVCPRHPMHLRPCERCAEIAEKEAL